MVSNQKQAAAANLAVAIGYLKAAQHLWSPSIGLSPRECQTNPEVLAWQKFSNLIDQIDDFDQTEGPGA